MRDEFAREGGKAEMLFAPAERGQGLLEYAMILILVSIFVIVLVSLIGPQVGLVFSNVVILI